MGLEGIVLPVTLDPTSHYITVVLLLVEQEKSESRVVVCDSNLHKTLMSRYF